MSVVRGCHVALTSALEFGEAIATEKCAQRIKESFGVDTKPTSCSTYPRSIRTYTKASGLWLGLIGAAMVISRERVLNFKL